LVQPHVLTAGWSPRIGANRQRLTVLAPTPTWRAASSREARPRRSRPRARSPPAPRGARTALGASIFGRRDH